MVEQTQSRFWGWIGAIVAAILVIWGISAIWGDRNQDMSTTEVTPSSDVTVSETDTTPDSMTTGEMPVTETDTTTSTATEPTASQADFVLTEDSDFDVNPDKYVGKTIEVDGEINETMGTENRLFTVDTDGLVGGDEVLIITKTAAGGPVEKGRQIRVVGQGRKFLQADLAALESELGFDLDDNLLQSYDQKLVIIAETVAAH